MKKILSILVLVITIGVFTACNSDNCTVYGYKATNLTNSKVVKETNVNRVILADCNITLQDDGGGNFSYNGNIDLNNCDITVNGNLTITGNVTGNGGITLNGGGNLVITGDVIGENGNSITLNGGGMLTINGTATNTHIVINGGGVNACYTIGVISGGVTFGNNTDSCDTLGTDDHSGWARSDYRDYNCDDIGKSGTDINGNEYVIKVD